MRPPAFAYVGTFTRHGRSDGIHVFRVTGQDGSLEPIQEIRGIPDPSFLALHPHRPVLYAVSTVGDLDGEPGGGLTAYRIDERDGLLRPLCTRRVPSPGPCQVSTDAAGTVAYIASYHGGAVSVVPLSGSGEPGPVAQVVQHRLERSADGGIREPRVHAAVCDRAGGRVLVTDLGLDRVTAYARDPDGLLTPLEQPFVPTPPGAGPRHLEQSADGRVVYAVHEFTSTVSVYGYDAEAGKLVELQTVEALPPGFTAWHAAADIHLHPNGRFLYVSVRGLDAVVGYPVDPDTGLLGSPVRTPSGGAVPRQFTFTPAGDLMMVGNQDADEIVAFAVDPTTGSLIPTGARTAVPSPTCVVLRQFRKDQ